MTGFVACFVPWHHESVTQSGVFTIRTMPWHVIISSSNIDADHLAPPLV